MRVGGREAIANTAMWGWLAGQCEDGVGGAEDVIGPWDCSAVIVTIAVAEESKAHSSIRRRMARGKVGRWKVACREDAAEGRS